jgi:hypothetical protein
MLCGPAGAAEAGASNAVAATTAAASVIRVNMLSSLICSTGSGDPNVEE